MAEPKPDERAIFNAARRLQTPEKRAEYLESVCGNDRHLHERIIDLLRGFEEGKSFLESPLSRVAATIDVTGGTEGVGGTVGPYRLRELIGEGGMGEVYVAEQTEPVRRKVALKIIRPGMATKDVLARFEAERQALAMMDHPNIAKVFDGGAIDSGQPYFVMELVQGPPITEYCDQQRLKTRERIEVFLQVCRAVHHAHQKGIIHRDLKPSNIVVSRIDGVAVPKVIDFGIAKAVGQKLTERTVYTQFSQMVGTPLYMSPEQAELGVIDIDIRSDVYSLGLLLYELLTGQTPFDSEKLKQAGLDGMRRIIREDEPPRPSARVSTLKAEVATTIADRRCTDARRLVQTVRGDLDWIVMKCLEKDRSRRYETANDLALDLKRHLENEPVVARSPSKAYRLQKVWRRNRLALSAAATVAVALLLATGVSQMAYLTFVSSLLAMKRYTSPKTAMVRPSDRCLNTELDIGIPASRRLRM